MQNVPVKVEINYSIKTNQILEQISNLGDTTNIDTIFDTIEGKELCNGKYQIGRYIDKGQHGTVFEATDMYNKA